MSFTAIPPKNKLGKVLSSQVWKDDVRQTKYSFIQDPANPWQGQVWVRRPEELYTYPYSIDYVQATNRLVLSIEMEGVSATYTVRLQHDHLEFIPHHSGEVIELYAQTPLVAQSVGYLQYS